jgi:uncharacterized membrane protein
MLLGAVLTLERAGVIAAIHVRQFWPVVLIVGGASMLLQRADSHRRLWGSFWMMLGACLLVNSLGIARVNVFGVAGPLLLILLGLAVMTRTFGGEQQRAADPGPAESALPLGGPSSQTSRVPPPLPGTAAATDDRVVMFAFMSTATRVSTDQSFRGGEVGAMLGQGRLDLRRAAIPRGTTVILDVFAFMAGHEIYVPPEWEVISDPVLILAEIQDARLAPIERRPADAPRLRLRGFAMIGEIVIRH